MEYDKEVTTITDILEALDKFDNKEEIIEAIKPSLYDIETDYLTEELFRQELDKYKAKEDKLIEWLKEEIKNCNPNPELYFKVEEGFKSKFFQEVLERLGE